MGNGMLSQEEIDALLHGALSPDPGLSVELLTDLEKDALGEIANISMGTAATTLSQLVGKKVEITAPKVDMTTSSQIRNDYPVPSIIVDVEYKVGLEGKNLLILSQRDGSVIVDLMMGGDGTNISPELSEMQISGISEAMNQMMGSAATSMSTMFHAKVDISPPILVLTSSDEETDAIHDHVHDDLPLVRISFRMVIEEVIDSVLIQVIPLAVGKRMVAKLLGIDSTADTFPPTNVQANSNSFSDQQARADANNFPNPGGTPNFGGQRSYANIARPAEPSRREGAHTMMGSASLTTAVQPVQFAPLHGSEPILGSDNLDLILDVPLQVSVELGKAKKTIKEILELGPGSVVELDRLAGEPVDMMVNGKLIAKCEVVVINETFGIRITDIVHPNERMKSIK